MIKNNMIINDFQQFADILILNSNIDLSKLELDHFGYQTSSKEDYERLKVECMQLGSLVSENIVGGRRVGIFRFNIPFKYSSYLISGFELVEPKEGQVCNSELDHLEFVINCTFDEYIENNKDVEWDLTAKDRDEFAKIVIKFMNGKSIKFHTKNIFEEIPKE